MDVTWKKLRENTERIGYRKLLHRTFSLPDGKEADYTILDYGPGAALVVALTGDGRFVVSRQYRPGPEKVMDELPGGFIDPGEEPADTAARELREETGYTAGSLELLGSFSRDAYISGTYYFYLARNCRQVEGGPISEEYEFIETVTLSSEEFIAAAVGGRMTDTAAALLALRKLGL